MQVALNGTQIRLWLIPAWLSRVIRWLANPFDGSGHAAAITFGHQVLILVSTWTETMLWHESQHARQAEACEPSWVPWTWLRRLLGSAVFQAKYIGAWVKSGYRANHYEEEAFAVSDWFTGLPEMSRPPIVYFLSKK